VLATGGVAELVGSPGTARTLGLSVGAGDGERALAALAAVPGVRAQRRGPDEVLLSLDGAPGADAAAVVAALVGAGVAVHALVPHRQLEQVFLDLVGQGS
uniref:hypothetical protein n=1 Tax=Escherichia coli TaxID=562 RepID=UPI0018EEEC7A